MKFNVIAMMSLAMVLLVSVTANAAMDTRIDFSDYAPTPDGNWTVIGQPTSSGPNVFALYDWSDASDTGVTLTMKRYTAAGSAYDNYSFSRVNNADRGWNGVYGTPWGPDWLREGEGADRKQNAARDMVYSGSNTDGRYYGVWFAGLDPTKTYDIELICSYQTYGDGYITDFTLGTAPVVTWDSVADGYVGMKWITWTGIAPEADGSLKLICAPVLNDRTALNAMRILEVPEPMTMSLLAVGGLALLRRRRNSI